jgi:hypothetical protein
MHPRGIAGYIIRSFNLLCGVIVISMAAALVVNQPTGGSPSQINYSVFVGVFSLLTLIYTAITSSLVPDGIGGAAIIIILDLLNLLFYLCGGIAMAVALRVHSCGNVAYVKTNAIIAGSTQRCHEAQTLTAFLWFGIFPLFCPPTSWECRLICVLGFASYVISAILTAALSGGVSMHRRSGVIPQMRGV